MAAAVAEAAGRGDRAPRTVAGVLTGAFPGQTEPIMMSVPPEGFPDLRRWSERRPAAAAALRLAALLFIAAVLVRTGDRDSWPLAGAGVAAGVVWTLATARRHPAAVPAAMVLGLIGAAMAGTGTDQSAGLTFMTLALISVQATSVSHTAANCLAAGMLGLGTLCALAAGAAGNLPWVVGITLGGYLLGDARRSRLLALVRAQELLVMTRRANAEEAHAAALAERGRIARDVHDVLAHSLSGLAIQLEAADALLSASGEHDVDAAHTMVVRARRLARDGLGEVRRAVAALREDVKPPEETLEKLVADYGADTGWPASFTVAGGPVPALAVEAAQALQRVAQEALTNARKHAPGAAVEVRLEVGAEAGAVTLAVENAPPGAAGPLADSGGGWGIVGLRERVGLLGGTLEAGATEGGGWLVVATVPVAVADDSEG